MGIDRKNKRIAISKFEVDENLLFQQIVKIVENRKFRVNTQVNQNTTIMYWEIGQHINNVVLEKKRAAYGKRILPELAAKLMNRYGKVFSERNLYRMVLFAERFPNKQILPPLAAKLTWSHIIELLPLKTDEAREFYANDVLKRNYGAKELRHQIARKAYERREIANTALSKKSTVPFNIFKDPYLLDFFGLKENYVEADLEKAILIELEKFILEFGHGFTFVERQKRMIIDGEDIVLDLLFFHRILKRLVAVELKLGVFKASYKGQMELYLKWLDKHERHNDEETPIGIILCATASREKIELLEMDKAGIAVAEYWTHLPPKAEFETKIKEILLEAKERLERRKLFSQENFTKQIDYFYEGKDDDE